MSNNIHLVNAPADYAIGVRGTIYVPSKGDVRVLMTTNVTISAPGATLDGVAMASGDRVALTGQTAPAENGIYQWVSAAAPMTRDIDADSAGKLVQGFQFYVREGTANGKTEWRHSTTAAITLGTTPIVFTQMGPATGGGSGTVTSITAGTGLTGGVITTVGTIAADFGSVAGKVTQGDDARLSDARTPTAHTHAFAALTSIPTTLAGYGIADAQPLDADLTTIAGLTATTDNFMQSKAGAWASRTIAQAKTDLGLPQTTITGNAGTATALATARTINGTPFNGTGDINIGVAALVLTGATLAANVVASSLTSVGTLSALLVTTSDAATNTASDGIVTNHNTSGTPAAGFGTKRKWQLQSNNTTLRDAADITVTWVTATDASRTARVVVNVFDTVTREGLRVEASGTAPMIGFLGANASAALASPDLGTLATTFGLASGTPTFAGANVTGTVPLATSAAGLLGGAATTSSVTIKTTTGVGATGADIVFVGGNNGGTEFGRMLNAGTFGWGTALPTGDFHVVNNATVRGIVSSIHIDGVNAAGFHLYKSRGTSGSSTTVADADFIGQITARPYGTAYNVRASIQFKVNGTVSGDTIPTDILFNVGGAGAVEAMRLTAAGNLSLALGGLTLSTVGKGIAIKEGTNACMGVATLVAGTVTVATTKITATSRVQITVYAPGVAANLGSIYEDSATRVAGTSFSIKSSNVLATPSVNWIIFEPA